MPSSSTPSNSDFVPDTVTSVSSLPESSVAVITPPTKFKPLLSVSGVPSSSMVWPPLPVLSVPQIHFDVPVSHSKTSSSEHPVAVTSNKSSMVSVFLIRVEESLREVEAPVTSIPKVIWEDSPVNTKERSAPIKGMVSVRSATSAEV